MPKQGVQTITKRPKRKYFTDRISAPLPDLIKIQKKSYQWFLKEGLHII